MHRWAWSLIALGMLAGCGPSPEQAGTPTASAWTATTVPSDTPTATAAPTETSTPSQEPTVQTDDSYVYYQTPNLTIYQRGNQFCVLSQNGKPVLLPNTARGRFGVSPDQKLLLFEQEHQTSANGLELSWTDLWSIRPDGSGLMQIVDLSKVPSLQSQYDLPPGKYAVGIADMRWIPGSHRLAFTTSTLALLTDPEYDGADYHNDLHVVDADTGNLRTLSKPGSGGTFVFPSPDERTIALIGRGKFSLSPGQHYATIITQDTVSLVSTDGSSSRHGILSYDSAIIPLNNGWINRDPGLAWLSDSSGVRVAIYPKNPREANQEAEITGWFIPVSGPARQIYDLQGVDLNTYEDWTLKPSPDARYLAFKAIYHGRGGLHIFDTVTHQDTSYLEHSYVRLEYWEADSRHFIVLSDDPADPTGSQAIPYRGVIGGDFTPVIKGSQPALPDCAP